MAGNKSFVLVFCLSSLLSFDGISCLHQNSSNILLKQGHNELGCPRTCLANKVNSCNGAKLGNDGRCYCPDGTLVKPVFTKDLRINISATKRFCLKYSSKTAVISKPKKDDSLSRRWEHCPDILDGGKEKCTKEKCNCAREPETGCMFGLCVCTLEGHLSFEGISCTDVNLPNILRNKSLHDLSCPRTCLANKYNSCLYGSNRGSDGKCYCPDGTLVKPTFTKDHRIDALATEEFCSDHQEEKERNTSKYWNNCPGIFDGGTDKCENKKCDCSREPDTGCMFGLCVCTLEGHLSFDGISCADYTHPNILRNKTLRDLSCPRTCLANEYNSCLYGSNRGTDGKCYCPDGTLVKPIFTRDHKIDASATEKFCHYHQKKIELDTLSILIQMF